MRLTQELLHHQVIRRITAVRPELTGLSTTADLVAAQAELTESSKTMVCCVIRRLDFASFIGGACAFAASLGGDEIRAWRHSLTKTIFLAGNPENLVNRFTFGQVTEDGLAAWTRPSTADELTGLRRLLKTFDGPRELPAERPVSVTLPGAPGRVRDLYLATAGVTIAETLVHLNHLLAEAVLDGLLGSGDRLVLRQVPRLGGVREPFDALRIGLDPAAPYRLRAFAGLTKEITHA